ncbi:MAG TPA: M6 family metalloprotease domain-containing protein [Kiritimatiellia bacterium]|nr:M6 family metalloprotease domain-containing protein [Kiritimatiellia bacterium]HPS06040.1 M6 family metalloprotease domain-containing protein [Kiritimatiellia bacterium]
MTILISLRLRRGAGTGSFEKAVRGLLTGMAALALLMPPPAAAVPACPDGKDVRQPDGSAFRLQLRGDEFFSWTETAAGYPVLHDASDGFWKYARPDAGRASYVIVPEARVGTSDPLGLGLSGSRRLEVSALGAALQTRRQSLKAVPEVLPVPAVVPGVLQTPDPVETPVPPPQPIPVAGTKTIRNVVLLACFSNHWNTSGSTVNASYGRVAVSEYSNLFNQVSHTSDGAVGSVRDYYSEVSYGKLTVQSVVSAWVKLPQGESYYGTDGGTQDTNWKQMIVDAVNAADTAGFDFAQGDSDGDGWVDCLTVIHSGHGQEITGNPATCIWSKQGEMVSTATKDGVKMRRCHTEPALRGATSSTSIIRIGVICHEMGHFFGLTDLYDYSATTDGVGDWGLMAYGSWNGSLGNRPAHFCAHSKYMLGFVRPAVAHSLPRTTLARVEDNPSVLLLRDGMTDGEYFLLENRANTGFDNDTASIFPGVLISHVDSKSVNNDLGTWPHPLVKIEEADGDDTLGLVESPTDIMSESGDVWTSTSGLAGGFRDQTGNTTANAMRYQSTTLYSRTNGVSSYSYLRVTNFSAAASSMTFDVQTLRTTVTNQTVYTTGHTVAWPAASQASQYEIQEALPAVLTGLSDGAEDEEAMYDAWHLSGGARRSSAGSRTGSFSYLFQYFSWSAGSFYPPVQSLTLQKPFTVTSGTTLSFHLVSHLDSAAGSLKCEISNDGGNTWLTLGTYGGYINSWTQYAYNFSALNAQGINIGDACIIRFVLNVEFGSGWYNFPEVGVAVDDIAVAGVTLGGYGAWTTLANNVVGTSYAVPARTNGVYAYRVRGYANAAWQEYGTVGETTVVLPWVSLSLTGPLMAEAGAVAIVTATLSQLSPMPVVVNLALSGTATETNDYTASAVSHAIVIPANTLSGTLALTAVQDLIDETNETVIVDIGSVLNGEEFGVQQVTATIADDDPPPGSFEEWVQNYCPGMDLPTALTNDYNADGVQNGFDYAFGPNLETNAPLLNIFCLTNAPVVDIPKQLVSTVPYVGIAIDLTPVLDSPAWTTNGLHAIDHPNEPTNRCWFAPDGVGTSGFFRVRGFLR